MVNSGVMPYYRLGVTIENYVDIKVYRIYPPKDYAKRARICEHIITHYNEGRADVTALNLSSNANRLYRILIFAFSIAFGKIIVYNYYKRINLRTI